MTVNIQRCKQVGYTIIAFVFGLPAGLIIAGLTPFWLAYEAWTDNAGEK